MAVITPNTDIYLLKVPLEINDINQLDFATSTAQYNYFNSLPKFVVEENDYSYQRKDNTIRFNGNFDELISYNYCMYRNTNYSNKWFYAYITNMEYINDNMTLITIKTDVWQTWQFELTFKPVLIDREHANTDVAGDNLLPESVELGDFVTNGDVINFGDASNYYKIVEVTMLENVGESQTLSYEWDDETEYNITPDINGVPRGTTPLIVGLENPAGADIDGVRDVYDLAGLSDAIINIYIVPRSLIPSFHTISLTATRGTSTITAFHLGIPTYSANQFNLGTSTFTKPTSIDGFTPKNKKLLTAPYCYFNISNNVGSSIPYFYEDFSGTVSFKTEGTFGVSGNVKTIPQNYKNISSSENALDYSVSGAKYPVCSWKSDSYTNWLTQNAVNMQTQWTSALTGGLIGIGTSAYQGGQSGRAIEGIGMAKGALGGAVVAGAGVAGGLISLAREQHLAKTQANLVPDQVHGNLNASDILWSKYRTPFTYLPMSIKAQNAYCIDEYFSQFGYKCNRVKVPNLTGRRNWNYVKTIGCYIEADIPQDDLAEIKNMFDRGITIWHNPNTFADYSQNNDII